MHVHEFLFSYYFKDSPTVSKYAFLLLNELRNGNTVTLVEEKDISKLMAEMSLDFTAGQAFVLDKGTLAMQRYFQYEQIVADFVTTRLKVCLETRAHREEILNKHRGYLEHLFSDFQINKLLPEDQNIDWQKVAVVIAFLQDFSILTGGPGTGKTTTVSKLLAFMFTDNPNLRVALTAQTGKASARLKESLDKSRVQLNFSKELTQCFDKIEPKTLHRLLGWKKNSVDFKHNAGRPLPYDVIIVDECSMVDLPMMAKLMGAVSKHTKLILLGDQNQLSSVEVGAVLSDLCNHLEGDINVFSHSFVHSLIDFTGESALKKYVSDQDSILLDAVVQLKRSYRFSSLQGLGQFAHKVINNESIDLKNYNQIPEKQGVIYVDTWQNSFVDYALKGFEYFLLEPDPAKSLALFSNFRVLCGSYDGVSGVRQTNLRIEQLLSQKKLIDCKEEYYINRPILVTKNDYNLGLLNGDVGLVKADSNGRKKVFFEDGKGGVKSFDSSFLSNLETVFAMTIHKSQGSEFKDVLLVLPNSVTSEVLNRQLLYTAITRAKEKVYVLGSQEVFDGGVLRVSIRNSSFKRLLHE